MNTPKAINENSLRYILIWIFYLEHLMFHRHLDRDGVLHLVLVHVIGVELLREKVHPGFN